MAQTITVMEKPDWISYDEIAELLHQAHRQNVEQGLQYMAASQNGEEIQKRLHGPARLYVALNENRELIGVSAIELKEHSKSWYGLNKPYGLVKLEGVRPDCQGMGVQSTLRREIEKYAFQHVDLLQLDTAEKNHHAVAVFKKQGWIPVSYLSRKTNNFYSIIMAKWKNGCPFSKAECAFRFWKRKLQIIRHYTKDGQPR